MIRTLCMGLVGILWFVPVYPDGQARGQTSPPPQAGEKIDEAVPKPRENSKDGRQLVRLPSLEPGIVASVHVKPGQQVRKGELLIRLDDRLVREDVKIQESSVQIAVAEREVAVQVVEEMRLRLDRLSRANAKTPGSISQNELTIAKLTVQQRGAQAQVCEGKVKVAEARLAKARLKLERHAILAPVDGVVRAIRTQPGEAARALETVVELQP